jgi:hypothetical protein
VKRSKRSRSAKGFIYDAGVLVAADRSERRVWADHRVRLEAGLLPLVPATVVAQVSRSTKQVQLRRFLSGCEVVALDEASAHESGRLLAKSRTADVVDASVVAIAVAREATIVTSDPDDLGLLVAAAGARLDLVTL